MSVEKNKALVRRLIETVNTRNWAVLDEVMAPDYVDHYALPGVKPGREGYRESFISTINAFPDLQFTIEDMIAEGDKVVVRMTFSGTHRGEIIGIAPTNKRVTYTHIHILRVVRGKFVEDWGFGDRLAFMEQLGVIPPTRLGK